MDLWKAIQELHRERQRLDRVIATLESLQAGDKPKSKRGRKNMPVEERRRVSQRMREYWEARRKGNKPEGSVMTPKIAVGF
jgi:hypothetical protein